MSSPRCKNSPGHQATVFVRQQIFLLLVTTLWVAGHSAGLAQLRDAFEGGRPRWQLGRQDVDAKTVSQAISLQQPHLGQGCERLEITCKQGSTLHLAYEITPSAITEALRANLWIRTASIGLRPAFRIRFPWTAHPLSGNQLQAFLWGPASTQGSQWIELQWQVNLADYANQVALLKAEFGKDLDLRDAYVEAIILDVYRGPGVVRLDIDDLTIDGMMEANTSRDGTRSLARLPQSPEEVQQHLQDQLHDLRRTIPHWIQYRGESLEWLKTIGITGVVLDRPQSLEWLQSAQQSGLQVLSPPPTATPPQNEWASYEAVHGWLLGSALDTTHVERSRELSQRLNQFPVALLRPTLAEAMENHWNYARIADLLAVPAPLPSTVLDGRELTSILRASYDRARGRTIPLTSLAMQPTPEWIEQDRALQEAIGREAVDTPRFDPLQARLNYYRCIAAGAQGWYVRSLTSLDSGDEGDLLRAQALRGLAAESQWLAPWLQATTVSPIPPDNLSGYQGTIHSLPNSQLFLLIATSSYDTLCPATPNLEQIAISQPNLDPRSNVLRITHGRLEPALLQTGPKQFQIVVPNPSPIELVMVTSDERVVSYLQQRANTASQGLYDTHTQIGSFIEKLANTTLVAERLPPNDPAWQTLREGQAASRSADGFAGRSNFADAAKAAERASMLYQSVVRASWERAIADFPSPHASPWVEQMIGLPVHWQLTRLLTNRTWQDHPIPGWNDHQFSLADWNGMEQLGWTVDRRLELQVDAGLSLTTPGSQTPKFFDLWSKSIDGRSVPGGFAGSSLRLATPPVQVPLHSIVRFDAQVRVQSSSQTPQAGLLVYDNLGGPASGELLRLTENNPNAWQPITLFRIVTHAEGVRLMIETRGEGSFQIRNLQLASIQPAAASQFQAGPVPLAVPR